MVFTPVQPKNQRRFVEGKLGDRSLGTRENSFLDDFILWN